MDSQKNFSPSPSPIITATPTTDCRSVEKKKSRCYDNSPIPLSQTNRVRVKNNHFGKLQGAEWDRTAKIERNENKHQRSVTLELRTDVGVSKELYEQIRNDLISPSGLTWEIIKSSSSSTSLNSTRSQSNAANDSNVNDNNNNGGDSLYQYFDGWKMGKSWEAWAKTENWEETIPVTNRFCCGHINIKHDDNNNKLTEIIDSINNHEPVLLNNNNYYKLCSNPDEFLGFNISTKPNNNNNNNNIIANSNQDNNDKNYISFEFKWHLAKLINNNVNNNNHTDNNINNRNNNLDHDEYISLYNNNYIHHRRRVLVNIHITKIDNNNECNNEIVRDPAQSMSECVDRIVERLNYFSSTFFDVHYKILDNLIELTNSIKLYSILDDERKQPKKYEPLDRKVLMKSSNNNRHNNNNNNRKQQQQQSKSKWNFSEQKSYDSDVSQFNNWRLCQ